MDLLIALIASIAFAFIFRNAILKAPVVFYAIAIAVDIFFLAHVLQDISVETSRTLQPFFNRGLFAYALFSVVMYIGAFSRKSAVRKYLQPIRGELSIIASILIYGHVINYLSVYLAQLATGFLGMKTRLIISLLVSTLLVIMLTILTVTSFNVVRKYMNRQTWKRIQWFAYPFFLLIYVHLFFVLAPATVGSGTPYLRMIIYSLVTIVYVILRILRGMLDHQEKANTAQDNEACV